MVILQSYFPSYNYQQDKSTSYDCWITQQTALKIAVSNLYCKITLVWLDSSLSVRVWCFGVLRVIHSCTCVKHMQYTCFTYVILVHSLHMYYMCTTTCVIQVHILHMCMWRNTGVITCVADIFAIHMFYTGNTPKYTIHVLQVWHNWSSTLYFIQSLILSYQCVMYGDFAYY